MNNNRLSFRISVDLHRLVKEQAKCRQLKRVILGPSARPTEQESAYGHSCQEVLYRLKVIGVNFFRRRVGGVMGETFFPDGLSRTLSLVGSKKVAQESQTAPIERLGSLTGGGASPALPLSRNVCVQVAGGIDAEDEPLMEQQVQLVMNQNMTIEQTFDGVVGR